MRNRRSFLTIREFREYVQFSAMKKVSKQRSKMTFSSTVDLGILIDSEWLLWVPLFHATVWTQNGAWQMTQHSHFCMLSHETGIALRSHSCVWDGVCIGGG